MAFPELMGYKEIYGKLAIVHFDSHSDTGYHPMDADAPFDHGTPFYDAITHGCVDTEHSIQIGMRGLLPEKQLMTLPIHRVWICLPLLRLTTLVSMVLLKQFVKK